ncbi:putative mediator of RNA polymerase II transcription subunit 29 [Calliphora vicina]|uniref:putative mediator of RNA polymerase II transcription subunit 29 n=1 Tax=Calliphora vicina TaxID=7373 RepID=UPI00325B5826
MKLYKSWFLPATCTIILVVTTYATSTEAAKQKQAEVNLQQVAAAPSRSLKYGDKTTKKIPNEEMLFLPTAPTLDKNKNNVNEALQTGNKHVSPNRPRSRVERIELPTNRVNAQIPRRYDSGGGSQQNQLVVQHDIPIVHKSRELFNKPITPTVGQQRNAISNRSRSSNTLTQTQQQQLQQLQPTQYSNLNNQTNTNIAKIKTTTATHNNRRQRKPTTTTTTSRTIPPSINNNQPPLSSRNANVHTHHSTTNSTIVSHHRGNQNNNKNNNIISSKSQPLLLASTNDVATTSGLQTKTETSSNRKRGNVTENQSVSSNITSNRLHIRKFTSTSTASTTITVISPPSTSTTTSRPPFQLPNNFNIFTPEFWQFLNPNSSPAPKIQATTTSTTTKKPPKKYKPPAQVTTKEEKLSLVKPKQTIPSRTTTKQPEFINKEHTNNNNNNPKKDDGPFRIALPTFNILSSKRETTDDDGEKGKRNVDKESNLRERFDCPRESEVRFQLFPKICKIDEDCKVWNREEICCEIFGAKSCVSGIPKPLEETSHAPILGVIARKCPSRPLAELWWEVKECENDMDCWPRVCCPDGRRRYCRTSQPELNTVPVPVQRSFNYLSEYLECTAPPPPIFDLHPKACTSTLDCFPNVCCQEAGLRHCRPPKKSVLTMLANVFNVDFVKRLTQNIVIK